MGFFTPATVLPLATPCLANNSAVVRAWSIDAASTTPSTIRRLASPYFVGCVAALGAVLVIGTSVNGQRNWIQIVGPFNLQPSEFTKLGVILWGSHVLAGKYHLLEQRRELLLPLLPAFALVLGLILAEGDLGTAMVIAPVMASLLFFVGGVALRLTMGPISLGPFAGAIEDSINRSVTGLVVHFDQAVLEWSRTEGKVNLIVLGTSVADASGHPCGA